MVEEKMVPLTGGTKYTNIIDLQRKIKLDKEVNRLYP